MVGVRGHRHRHHPDVLAQVRQHVGDRDLIGFPRLPQGRIAPQRPAGPDDLAVLENLDQSGVDRLVPREVQRHRQRGVEIDYVPSLLIGGLHENLVPVVLEGGVDHGDGDGERGTDCEQGDQRHSDPHAGEEPVGEVRHGSAATGATSRYPKLRTVSI